MSLTTKAIDRLIARVVTKLADRVIAHPAAAFPVHPSDIDKALTRAIETATKERLDKILDDGGFDHRVNDTIDYEIGRRLESANIADEAKDRLDNIVEEKLDQAGFDRKIERAIENIDIESMVQENIDNQNLDFEDMAKDIIEQNLPDMEDLAREEIVSKLGEHDPAAMMKDHAGEFVEAALIARYESPVGGKGDAMQRAAAEVISAAVATVVGEASAALEQEAEVQS